MPARVFISSRQRTQEERYATKKVEEFLIRRGYETYVATNEQVGRDANSNLLQKIQEYEYFLLINFREFSTYVFQELAVARFLDKKLMVFQEQSIEEKNRIETQGVGYAMQLNPIEFNGIEDLLKQVKSLLKRKEAIGEWDKEHRDELSIEQSNFEPEMPNPEFGYWFYNMRVRNNSKFTHARSCAVYISSIVQIGTVEKQVYGLFPDVKWAGLALPNAEIYRNGHTRYFAAVCIHNDVPEVGCIYQAVDNLQIPHPIMLGTGDFRLTYHVVSDSFPEVKCVAHLTLGERVEDFRFSVLE